MFLIKKTCITFYIYENVVCNQNARINVFGALQDVIYVWWYLMHCLSRPMVSLLRCHHSLLLGRR